MGVEKGIDTEKSAIFSDRQIIAIATILFAAATLEHKYDFIEEYLTPSTVELNRKEVKNALETCINEADGVLTPLALEECVEDEFQENTANFREVSCKIDQNGEGKCDLAKLF